MRRQRSPLAFVQTDIDVKSWMMVLPSVDAVRPGRCPLCGAASRPVRGRLVLHGHGLRLRFLRGPLVAEGVPEELEIALRRYRCQICEAVVAVGPAGIISGRLYSAMAIALAFVLYGAHCASHAEVRRRVSPWRPSRRDPTRSMWITLLRWVEARQRGTLFPRLLQAPPGWRRRAVAERTALVLASAVASTPDLSERVFLAASRAA